MTPVDPAASALSFDQLYLNGQAVAYCAEGTHTAEPDDHVLLAHASDLNARAPWAAAGYAMVPSLPGSVREALQAGLAELLREAPWAAGRAVGPGLDVVYHHCAVSEDLACHLVIIAHTKAYSLARLPVALARLEALVGNACDQPVRAHNPNVDEAVFYLRVVRSSHADYNPLPRDAWLPRYHGALNTYLPVAGSAARSSLTLVSSSHHWSESAVARTAGGAFYRGVPYTVPGVRRLVRWPNTIRPDPGPGEVLVFLFFLLHGAAANLNEDTA